ncbi:hypothetical protein [Gemella morbillorum]
MQRTTFDYLIIIVPIVISLISVIISSLSLYQAKKSIYNSSKPYVVPYIETIYGLNFQKNLTIKNFGKTPARILELTFHTELDSLNNKLQMKSVVGSIIAPNQKFSTNLHPGFKGDVKLTLKYKDQLGKITVLEETLKTNISESLLFSTGSHPDNTSDEVKAIRESAITLISNFK